ncbi:hypothetical protein GF314_13970 [bacterium]|nr:hypothetical protein [bacterium]
MPRTRVLIPCLILLLMGEAVAAPLDRDEVLRLARERSVAIQVARAEVDRAAGELRTARTWRHNPELDVEAGPRRGPDGETWDRSIGLSQRLDLAGRGARIDAAGAEHAAARDRSRAIAVTVLSEAACYHLEALHAAQRRRLAGQSVDLHQRLLEIARRRHEAGETGTLDVHRASVAAARARMRLATAEAAEQERLTRLATLLALEPGCPIEVAGDLAWPLPGDVARVQAAVAAHPELDALDARLREAEALVRVAGAARWPEVGLGARIGREEEADVLRFGLSLGLPVFDRGAGDRAVATAAGRIAAIELETARRVRTDRALRAWARHRELAATLAAAGESVTAAVDASGRLSQESYRLGEIPLDRVLLVQRDNLEARNELNDLRLTAALAALEVAEIAALPPLAAATEVSR